MIQNQVKKYKATLRPLEYYHFATEPNFWTRKRIINNGGTGDGQTPYYVTSEKLPSQTTLLGAMRYLVLKQNNELGFNQSNTVDLIGTASFDFSNNAAQCFGYIKRMGTLFISNPKTGTIVLKRPRNLHTKNEGLELYQFTSNSNQSYFKDFKEKDDDGEGFVKIEKKRRAFSVFQSEAPLFSTVVKTRINKAKRIKPGGNDDEAFFKVEMIKLHPDYVFQFYIEFDARFVPKSDVLFLGAYKAAFEVTFTEIVCNNTDVDEETELEECIKATLNGYSDGTGQDYYYAFSDVYLSGEQTPDFSISNKRYFKNLKTENGKISVSQSDGGELYVAGSVFYAKDESFAKNENARKIGLNHLIKISKEQDNDSEQ